jgi:hypothetical protein
MEVTQDIVLCDASVTGDPILAVFFVILCLSMLGSLPRFTHRVPRDLSCVGRLRPVILCNLAADIGSARPARPRPRPQVGATADYR